MNRYTRGVVLVVALALLAAACGDDDTTTTTSATTTTAAATTTTRAPDPDFVGDSVAAENCDYGGKILSITATSEFEVVFELCKPVPAFPQIAAFTPFGIQPKGHLEATGGAPLDNPIGTGPFVLEQWQRGDSIIFSRNDDYWGTQPPYETLVFRWATEGASRLLELQTGRVDQITNVSPDDFGTVRSDPNLNLIESANPNTFYLAMTNTFTPFNNLKVRQAVAMGINKQRIVDNFYPAGSQVADYFTPCSIPNACEGQAWYGFDADAARTLLEEGLAEEGLSLATWSTTIYFRDVFRGYLPEPSTVAVEIQTQLQENLGINATVQMMESGAFIDESTNGRLDGFYLLGWGADYPHITNFLDFHFGAANPQFGDPHPEIYEPLLTASSIGDVAVARPLYEQANNAIRALVPMVPVAHGASASAALAGVQNAHFRPFGAPLFEFVDPGKDTFVWMQNAEPISLFCADETDGESLAACQQVVEALLGYAIDSGEVVPALATGCTPNDDATVWTCTLRQGVKFHNGADFDANDVVASWALGIQASNPLHVGNTGAFEYYTYLWDQLIP